MFRLHLAGDEFRVNSNPRFSKANCTERVREPILLHLRCNTSATGFSRVLFFLRRCLIAKGSGQLWVYRFGTAKLKHKSCPPLQPLNCKQHFTASGWPSLPLRRSLCSIMIFITLSRCLINRQGTSSKSIAIEGFISLQFQLRFLAQS